MTSANATPVDADDRNRAPNPKEIRRFADLLLDRSASIYLQSSKENSPLTAIPNDSYDLYVEEMIHQLCGPIGKENRTLRVLAELYILGYQNLLRLHAELAEPGSDKSHQVRGGLIVQLTGELRRLAKTISELRTAVDRDLSHSRSDRTKRSSRTTKSQRLRVVTAKKGATKSKLGSKVTSRKAEQI